MHASEPLGNVVIAIVVLYCLVMLGNWAIAIAIVIGVMWMHQHQKNVLYSMHRRVCTLEEQAVKLQTMPRRVRALEEENDVECAQFAHAVPVGRRRPIVGEIVEEIALLSSFATSLHQANRELRRHVHTA